MRERCFACDRPIHQGGSQEVDTRDSQIVRVGRECYKKVMEAGEKGWQPPKGGPRLYPLPQDDGSVASHLGGRS